MLHVYFTAVYISEMTDVAARKGEEVATYYADLFPDYPSDLMMASDLAAFVRLHLLLCVIWVR